MTSSSERTLAMTEAVRTSANLSRAISFVWIAIISCLFNGLIAFFGPILLYVIWSILAQQPLDDFWLFGGLLLLGILAANLLLAGLLT
jgi:hypothetical protein